MFLRARPSQTARRQGGGLGGRKHQSEGPHHFEKRLLDKEARKTHLTHRHTPGRKEQVVKDPITVDWRKSLQVEVKRPDVSKSS